MRIRSAHLYRGGFEYVIDAIAEPGDFERANGEVFSKVLEELMLGGQPESQPPTSAPTPAPTPG